MASDIWIASCELRHVSLRLTWWSTLGDNVSYMGITFAKQVLALQVDKSSQAKENGKYNI